MKRSIISLCVLILVLVIFATVGYVAPEKVIAPDGLSDLIVVNYPTEGSTISSPITVTGRARGYWFFEASAPVYVVDWDGRIIGQSIVTAEGDWMTESFVPFKGTITFTTPTNVGEFSNKGAVIFKNDNPSGDPARDKAVEIPIFFSR
jgi:hypothetical protein